jgi:hypothetical protein
MYFVSSAGDENEQQWGGKSSAVEILLGKFWNEMADLIRLVVPQFVS